MVLRTISLSYSYWKIGQNLLKKIVHFAPFFGRKLGCFLLGFLRKIVCVYWNNIDSLFRRNRVFHESNLLFKITYCFNVENGYTHLNLLICLVYQLQVARASKWRFLSPLPWLSSKIENDQFFTRISRAPRLVNQVLIIRDICFNVFAINSM